jgi:hypothetical protein
LTDVSALDAAPAFGWCQPYAADQIGFCVPRMLQMRSIVIASLKAVTRRAAATLNDAAGRNGDDKVEIPGFAKIGRIQPAALNGVTVQV